MAMKEVTFKCGHSGERWVRGRGGQATIDSLEWWALRDCSDCWKAGKAAEVEALSVGLPELEGSEKQVNWAKRIRVGALQRVEEDSTKLVEVLKGGILDPIKSHKAVIQFEEDRSRKLELLKRVVAARFWIEVREKSGLEILEHVDLKWDSVTTVWFAKQKWVATRSWRGGTYVGGTKPHYTEHKLAEVV